MRHEEDIRVERISGYEVIMEKSPAGIFVGTVRSIPGVIGQARSAEELRGEMSRLIETAEEEGGWRLFGPAIGTEGKEPGGSRRKVRPWR